MREGDRCGFVGGVRATAGALRLISLEGVGTAVLAPVATGLRAGEGLLLGGPARLGVGLGATRLLVGAVLALALEATGLSAGLGCCPWEGEGGGESSDAAGVAVASTSIPWASVTTSGWLAATWALSCFIPRGISVSHTRHRYLMATCGWRRDMYVLICRSVRAVYAQRPRGVPRVCIRTYGAAEAPHEGVGEHVHSLGAHRHKYY